MGNRQSCLKVGRSYSTDSLPNTPVGDDDFNRNTPGGRRRKKKSTTVDSVQTGGGENIKTAKKFKEESQTAGSTSIKERESAETAKDTDDTSVGDDDFNRCTSGDQRNPYRVNSPGSFLPGVILGLGFDLGLGLEIGLGLGLALIIARTLTRQHYARHKGALRINVEPGNQDESERRVPTKSKPEEAEDLVRIKEIENIQTETKFKKEPQETTGHGSTSITERESAKLAKNTDVNTEYQVSASKLAKPDKLVKHEGHIMFSYNWSDSQPTALKIHDHLYGKDYPLWIDIKEMQGNINDKMAYAVENSCIVLMFCSQKYEESHNCQKEASYADTLKKRIIPIYTQKGYTPKGNCGLITAQKLYFDFSSGSFDENMKKLIKELGPATTYKKPKSDDMPSTSSSLPKQHQRYDLICGNGLINFNKNVMFN